MDGCYGRDGTEEHFRIGFQGSGNDVHWVMDNCLVLEGKHPVLSMVRSSVYRSARCPHGSGNSRETGGVSKHRETLKVFLMPYSLSNMPGCLLLLSHHSEHLRVEVSDDGEIAKNLDEHTPSPPECSSIIGARLVALSVEQWWQTLWSQRRIRPV